MPKLSDVMYHVELPNDITIYNVSYVLLLYLYNSLTSCFINTRNQPASPSNINIDLPVVATVERIFGRQECVLPNQAFIIKFFVYWGNTYYYLTTHKKKFETCLHVIGSCVSTNV